jgi:signal peptidase II
VRPVRGGLVKQRFLQVLAAIRGLPHTAVLISLGVVVLIADQVTKFAAVAALTRGFESAAGLGDLGFWQKLGRFLWLRHPERSNDVEVIQNFWHFRYVENPGAAWGFLSGSASSLRTPFFLLVAVAAMVFIVFYYRKTAPGQFWLRTALAMVFAGAVGNFLDRVRLGYVIDFVDWHWYAKATWPTFNVADAAISTGVVMMLLEMMIKAPEAKKVADTGGKSRG